MKKVKFDFDGANVIVVGASSGIGRQVAVDIVEAGGRVLAVARNELSLQQLKKEYNNSIEYVVCDMNITSKEEFQKKIGSFVDSYGKFAGGVYTAGITGLTPLKYYDENLALQIMNTSLLGMAKFCSVICKNKISEKNLSIVVLSSVASYTGGKSLFAYSAAKAGVRCAVKSIAQEIGIGGRRINCVSPGWVHTAMTDNYSQTTGIQGDEKNRYMLGLGNVSDISQPILFLLSDASAWMTGSDMVIDGGFMLGGL